MNDKPVRPTKKQKELLAFIEAFIAQNGYSPSYREIMKGCGYTSVATVALHVNSLIKRGHIVKRDHAARSLEVVANKSNTQVKTNQISATEEKWLIEKVEYFFSVAEQDATLGSTELDKLYVLVGALKVLGLEGAANSFIPRLSELKKHLKRSA